MNATATAARGFREKSLNSSDLIPLKTKYVDRTKKDGLFDTQDFFLAADVARTIRKVQPKDTIFSQGDICKDVMYIQEGEVKLSVVSCAGKEAVVAILKSGDFVGEGALAGQLVRGETATALTPAKLFVMDRKEMVRALHAEHAFSDHFITYMLERNIRFKKDLIDQLFNCSEKRLARILLLLAGYGSLDKSRWVLLNVSQETLAGMVGTTRSRVNLFMNKFKKLGFIQYNGGLQVNDSLLSVVMHDL
jgi:CRP/FNR family transcriptional regulator, cyclic AMP receptor protein